MALKVNLGCGPVGKEGWVNLDWGILAFLHRFRPLEGMLLACRLFPKNYRVLWPRLRLHDCRKRLPFKDGSVDFIYTSHVLEHFKRFEAESILCDCFRALRPGGVIRVTVPDVEILVRKYLERDKAYFARIRELMNFGERPAGGGTLIPADVLMDNFYPASHRVRSGLIQRLLGIFVRPHVWMYDRESLSALLEAAGFRSVRQCQFRQGRVPDLDTLDVFPEMTLFLEAEK